MCELSSEKIELRQIMSYVPYGLKMISNNDFVTPLIIELRVDGFQFMINTRKPILRPISDLTKEIEINGEKFIPLLRIIDHLNIKYTKYTVSGFSIDLVLNSDYHRSNTKTKQPQKPRFWFSIFQGTSFYCTNMNLLMYKDLFGAMEKMYEWHFDVHDLIKKNLATDINTIQELTHQKIN